MTDADSGFRVDPTDPHLLERFNDSYDLYNFVDETSPAEQREFLRRIPDAETFWAAAAILEEAAAFWREWPTNRTEFLQWADRVIEHFPQVCDMIVYNNPFSSGGRVVVGQWEVGLWLTDGEPDAVWREIQA